MRCRATVTRKSELKLLILVVMIRFDEQIRYRAAVTRKSGIAAAPRKSEQKWLILVLFSRSAAEQQ